MVARTGKS